MTDTAEEVDGRRLRREQNRQAVIDALVELLHEGHYQPSANEVAARAGLSPRSLFRYFDDIDDLNHAAIERQLDAARPLLTLDVDARAPTATKIGHLVEGRMQLFETIQPAARAARACAHRHGVVAAQLRQSRSFLRHQLRRLFAAELAERPLLFHALDALCSFETHEMLRVDQGLSRAKAVAALEAALHALLDQPGGST